MATLDVARTAPPAANRPSAGLFASTSLANTGHFDPSLRRSYPFGARPCRIYRPSPSPVQSPRRAGPWMLEFERQASRRTRRAGPFDQLRLTFPTLDAAVGYAEQHGPAYRVVNPPPRRPTALEQVPEFGPEHPHWFELLFQA